MSHIILSSLARKNKILINFTKQHLMFVLSTSQEMESASLQGDLKLKGFTFRNINHSINDYY